MWICVAGCTVWSWIRFKWGTVLRSGSCMPKLDGGTLTRYWYSPGGKSPLQTMRWSWYCIWLTSMDLSVMPSRYLCSCLRLVWSRIIRGTYLENGLLDSDVDEGLPELWEAVQFRAHHVLDDLGEEDLVDVVLDQQCEAEGLFYLFLERIFFTMGRDWL